MVLPALIAAGAGLGLGGALIGASKSPEQRQREMFERAAGMAGQAEGVSQLQGLGGQQQRLGNRFLSQGAPQIGGSQIGGDFLGALQSQFQGQGPGQEIARRQAEQAAAAQSQRLMGAGERQDPRLASSSFRQQAQGLAGIGGAASNAATMGGLHAQQQAISPLLQGLTTNAQLGQRTQEFNVGSQFQNRLQALQAMQQAGQAHLGGGQLANQRFSSIASQPLQPNKTDQFLGMLGSMGGLAASGMG